MLIALLLITLTCLYLLLRRRYRYWSNKNVVGPKPILIFGNMFDMIINRHSTATQFRILYERTKALPYAGIYLFHRPALLINSLDMIKTVFIKDFSHFMDHDVTSGQNSHPLADNLFEATGSRWKMLRNKLTPAFTSSKMKYMFNTMMNCEVELREFLKNNIETDIDIKDVMEKYTTDVIVSCAFGIDNNSFKYPENDFRKYGRKIFDFDFKRSMAFFLGLFIPDIQKIINLPIFEESLSRFFINAVDNTVKFREMNNIKRNDLLQLMIQIKNNESIEDKDDTSNIEEVIKNIQIDNKELAGVAFGFYAGGLDTSSSTLTFIFYELAKNKDVQDKLRNEINHTISQNGNEIIYEALNSMTYMYQVIEECLRLHSPSGILIRVCTKDYLLPGTNKTIDKGTPVFIPTHGIHMDSEIYPEPENFDPDRFSTENKASRSNLSLLSFGEGPRICIGNRFAILQMRIAIFSILKDYEVSLANDRPLVLTKNSFIIQPIGLLLKLTKLMK